MATTPQFASTPAIGSGTILTALAGTLTAPTNTVNIFTAGSSGSRVDEIDICALATNIANVIRIYVLTSTTYSLLKEIQIPANTASATLAAYQQTLTFNNLVLPTGYSLVAGVAATEGSGFRLTVFGGSF
jgi:hypothetical protein